MKLVILLSALFLTANFAFAQMTKQEMFDEAAQRAVEINSAYSLKFSPATDILTAADKENLGKIVEAFKKFPRGTMIEIGAHVFAAPDSQSNLDLSNKRAAAVRKALVDSGVNPQALTAKGYGEKRPVYATENLAERQKNNRIEFLVSPNSFKEKFAVVLDKTGDSADKKARKESAEVTEEFESLIEEYGQEIKAGLKNNPDPLSDVKKTPETAILLIAEMNKLTFVFEKGKPELAAASQNSLQKLADLFRSLPKGAIVLIENHVSEINENKGTGVFASEKLTESEAKMLSIQRNIALADFLLKAGAADGLFKLSGQGFKKPVASNETAEGRAKNARVEFSLHPDSFKTVAANRIAPVPADRITFNKGWGKIIVGANVKEVFAALGKPEKEASAFDISDTTYYYPQKGLSIVADFSNKITSLTFYGDASVNPMPKDSNDARVRYSSFALQPDKISWRASRESVIAAYGKPDAEQKGSEYPASGGFMEVTLLRYGSTWLYFKDNKLYKIVI